MIAPSFIARHLELAAPRRFSTGSLIRLDEAATAAVTPEMVDERRVFDRGWLRANRAIDRLGTWLKTMPFPRPVMAFLDRATPVQRALCGANASLFREDALKVNGFDETIKYGGGDKEFGVRLENAGVRGGTCATPRRSCTSTTRGATRTRRSPPAQGADRRGAAAADRLDAGRGAEGGCASADRC